MIDPDQLLDQVVTTLRDMPALVATIGSASYIVAYHHDYPETQDRLSAVAEMTPPSILVAWTATRLTGRSAGIEHVFSAYLKPLGQVGRVFRELREGVVTASGAKLKTHQIVPECHPPDVQACENRSLFLSGQAIIDYHEVIFRITERGADN